VPFGALVPFAIGGGLLESLAFAPFGAWPVAFVAVATLAILMRSVARPRDAVALGLAYGLAFNLVTLSWQASVLVASYLGLAAMQAAYFGLLGGLLYSVRSLRWTPLASACCWVMVEAVQARFPFGGFGWTRLGYAMVDTPLAGLYPLVGVPAVSFVVALVGHAAAWALASRSLRRAAVVTAIAAACFLGGAAGSFVPGAPAAAPTIDVGWVQGGASGGGFYGLGEAGQTGLNHAAQTRTLMAAVAAGKYPKPAFIVWPENGTDADPFVDPTTNKLLADAVADAGVPILVGVPTNGPGKGERQTTNLWWTNAGVTARYDKRDLVPFGEWIPFRDILLPAIPILDVIGDQAIPGDTPGALHVAGPDGRPLSVGVALCYEVAFPQTIFDAVDAGAEVMVVGSNNAMFQGTPQIEQQFAITRVRAAELRRQILVVTTSGISGLIDDHGRVVMRGAEHVGDSGVVTLTRTATRSPLLLGGWVVEYLIAGSAVVAAALGSLGALRRQRAGQ
jgi:apolipoprotein N-acyltransferase